MEDLGIDIAIVHNRASCSRCRSRQSRPGGHCLDYRSESGPDRADLGSVLRTFSGGIIRYTGFQVDLRKRMSNRYQGGIAYTLSRGKDNSFNMINNIQDPHHPDLSYGSSNNDVRHRLVGHAEVLLPFDIQIGTIMEARTNAPLNVTAGGRDLRRPPDRRLGERDGLHQYRLPRFQLLAQQRPAGHNRRGQPAAGAVRARAHSEFQAQPELLQRGPDAA